MYTFPKAKHLVCLADTSHQVQMLDRRPNIAQSDYVRRLVREATSIFNLGQMGTASVTLPGFITGTKNLGEGIRFGLNSWCKPVLPLYGEHRVS